MNKDQFKKILSKTIVLKEGGESAISKELINLEDKVQEVDLKIDNSIEDIRSELETIKLDEEKVVEKMVMYYLALQQTKMEL
jgi:molybdopterin-biosynthesis enzyme MoeA-like protein